MNELELLDIKSFFIVKKNKRRKITTYVSDDCELKHYHYALVEYIEKRFTPSIFTKGYIKNTSIYHNALTHLYNDYFIKIDVKDFFLNINHKTLANNLYYELNRENKNSITKKECLQLVDSCSISKKGLPLGLVTSPILSNVYMKDFDNKYYGNLKKLNLSNLIYTRYADDIIVSFKDNEIENVDSIFGEIINITTKNLKQKSLKINNKKTKFYNLSVSNHVKITGVNIIKDSENYRHLSVGRKSKNKLFWDVLDAFENDNYFKRDKLKGLYSFYLSIEKEGIDKCFSDGMKQIITEKGFSSFDELIKAL